MDETHESSRRDALRKLGAGAATAWVAPLVLSTPAIAQTSPGGGTTTTTGGGPPTPNGRLFDYTGGNRVPGLEPPHTQLATANSLTYTSGNVLPADLASYNCIVLSAHRTAFSASEVALLAAALAAGRTVIYETDSRIFGAGAMASVFNALTSALGVSITDQNLDLDGACYVGVAAADPLTSGVTQFPYNLTSALVTAGSARVLLRGRPETNQVIAAAQAVGAGTFVAVADVNVFSDFAGVAMGTCYLPLASSIDTLRANVV